MLVPLLSTLCLVTEEKAKGNNTHPYVPPVLAQSSSVDHSALSPHNDMQRCSSVSQVCYGALRVLHKVSVKRILTL